ncbi:hypothetical protein [Burkholderia perseverans]|uniref:hypothetical protein n=1 Tax=Burkholderia perseverans TaxID=2615214 RepID=UPI003140241B
MPTTVYGFELLRVAACPRPAKLPVGVPVRLFKNGNDVVPDVPPGWQHAAQFTRIGAPALPFPNVEDHAIERVIAALAPVPCGVAAGGSGRRNRKVGPTIDWDMRHIKMPWAHDGKNF